MLYERDARIPCESTLSMTRTAYQVDIDDYTSELVHGLSEAWQLARKEIQRSQKKQKYQCDCRAKLRNFQAGDRVMVYMPYEQTGKNRKLSRPYFGPYRVLEVHPNGVTVRPVDRPNDKSFRINLDRVTLCPMELSDKSWLGWKCQSRRAHKT